MLKGISYYKCLRQFTNKSDNQKQQQMQHQHQQQLDMEQQTTKDQNWAKFFAGTATFLPGYHHLNSSSFSRPPVPLPENGVSSHPAGYRTLNSQPIHESIGSNNHGQHYKLLEDSNQLAAKSMSLTPATADHFTGSLPTNKLVFNSLNPSSSLHDKAQLMVQLPQHHSATMKPTRQASRDNPRLLILPEKHQHQHHHQQPQSIIHVESSSQSRPRSRQQHHNNKLHSSSTNLFMVKGRNHRIIAATNGDTGHHSEPISQMQLKITPREKQDLNNNNGELQRQHEHQKINESLPDGLSFRKINDDHFEEPENSSNNILDNSESNLLHEVMKSTKPKAKRKQSDTLYNTVRSNGTTYTLLSVAQLDKLSRKLAKGNGRNTINQPLNDKYRSIHATNRSQAANQAPSTSSGKRDSGLAHDLSSASASSSSSLSASSSGPLSDTNSTSCGPDIESDVSLPTNSRLERKHARLLGIRQTEEQLVAANLIKVAARKHNTRVKGSSSQDLSYLPGKCKYSHLPQTLSN